MVGDELAQLRLHLARAGDAQLGRRIHQARCFQQGQDALGPGQSPGIEEVALRLVVGLELRRVDEVGDGDDGLADAVFAHLVGQKSARGDEQVDVGLIEPEQLVEVHLRAGQEAGDARVALAAVEGDVVVAVAAAALADRFVGDEGGVGADDLVVVERLHHRQAGLLQRRQDGRRHLVDEAVDVDDVGAGVGHEALNLVARLARVKDALGDVDLRPQPRLGQLRGKVDGADEVVVVGRGHVARVPHAEWDDLVAVGLQQRGQIEAAALRPAAQVVEAVDHQDLHRVTIPRRRLGS